MPTVSDIHENRGRVEIVADGYTIARIRKAHYDKCPLTPGDEIDVDDYFGRIAAVQFADAYEAALTSLDFSARSGREIGNTLRRKGYVEPVIESVIERLTENHLIDDRRYAERMAEIQAQRPVGLYAVKRKLRAKGISDEDAEAVLEVFDEDHQKAAAQAIAKKLSRKYEGLPEYEARAKLSQALARRGFSWDIIGSILPR